LDSFSFHVPFHTGSALEHPKAAIQIKPVNAQPTQLFLMNIVSVLEIQPLPNAAKCRPSPIAHATGNSLT
jgi:hypothetical protein